MKKFICTSVLLCCLAYVADCQIIKPKETVKRKAEDRANTKADGTIDKALDKVEEGIGNLFKKKKKKEDTAAIEEAVSPKTGTKPEEKQDANTGSFKTYSKFDFISGDKVLYYDDFERADVGDFPTEWNTNSSAEIVTINNQTGKWLSITKDGFFQPEKIKDLPENFTLEFNILNRYRSNNILSYSFSIYKTANARKDISNSYPSDAFSFNWNACIGTAGYTITEKDEEMGKNEDLTAKGFICNGEEFETPSIAKISLWRQKNRLRIYVNEEKVADLPQAFNSSIQYNAFRLGAKYMNYSNGRTNDDVFMVSDLKFAVGAPDTRNKLLTTGRFSTTGILFDFQKATVKAESYGIIKEIATVLKENAAVKVKVVGHTSNDGDAAANLQLSKQRSIAVKNILVKEFGIEENRLETDGKGGAELVDTSNTPEGKANNRRVEFVKLPQ